MVGIGTALADDPQLTVRDAPSNGRQPLRVVVDSKGRLPASAAMLKEAGATIVATAGADVKRCAALTAAGAEVVDTGDGDGVDLDALLKALGKRDVVSVLVEGGAGLLGSLFDRQLVDKVVAVVAPVVIGGAGALGPVGGSGAQTMQDALRLTRVRYRQLDTDVVVTGYPSPKTRRAPRRKRE
jgi:diaminohydroxyphosphoribosylaminopyrimidine deaminase/5-amino-6-(5-phosphoribosylamino)uracil reductase